ncbi:MAG: hypothetical protein JWN88_77 [Frankiales bacterium]|jgi:hypothetical protein|nr:hypothetical protein [Frankiales bacterium]
MSEMTGADWARCAGLLAMASLVFLVIYGDRGRALLALLAFYAVLASVAFAVVRLRRSRT